VNEKFTHAIDFWLDNIVPGFITKFLIDTAKSYSAERKNFYVDLEEGTFNHCILLLKYFYIKKV
jgi:hypothetical protein